MERSLTILDQPLRPCSTNPLTGFYRNSCCDAGIEDHGSPTVCAIMTAEFLAFSANLGNDLGTPHPEYGFAGLTPGDRWCLCAARALLAAQEHIAPKVVLTERFPRRTMRNRPQERADLLWPLKMSCAIQSASRKVHRHRTTQNGKYRPAHQPERCHIGANFEPDPKDRHQGQCTRTTGNGAGGLWCLWCAQPCATQSRAGNCHRSSRQLLKSDALERRSGRPGYLWRSIRQGGTPTKPKTGKAYGSVPIDPPGVTNAADRSCPGA